MKIDRTKFLAAVAMLSSAACEVRMVQPRNNGAPPPPAATAAPGPAPAAEGGPVREGGGPAIEGGGPVYEGGPTTEGRGPTSEGTGPAVEGGPAGEGVLDPASARACDTYVIGPCAEGSTLADSCRDTATYMKPANRAKYLACLQTDLAPVKIRDASCASVASRCSSAKAQCRPLSEAYDGCYGRASGVCNNAPEVKKQDECWRDCSRTVSAAKDPASRKAAQEACKSRCGAMGTTRSTCMATQVKACDILRKPLDACYEQSDKACTAPPACVAPISKACEAGYEVLSKCSERAAK